MTADERQQRRRKAFSEDGFSGFTVNSRGVVIISYDGELFAHGANLNFMRQYIYYRSMATGFQPVFLLPYSVMQNENLY